MSNTITTNKLFTEDKMDVKLDFREALRLDMERKGLTGAAIGRALGITQQAVHRWLERGFPPVSQLNALLDLLGPDSAVSKLDHAELYSDRSRVKYRFAPQPPETQITISDPRAKYLAIEKDFLDALPVVLRGNVEGQSPSTRPNFPVDYASDRVAAELIMVSNAMASHNTHAAILRLLTYAQKYNPQINKILIIITRDPHVRLASAVRDAAETFNVNIVNVTTGTDAAKVVTAAEGIEVPELIEPDE